MLLLKASSLPLPQKARLRLCNTYVMQASAVVDRIRRAIATTSDNVSARIQPIAKAFGKAFGRRPLVRALLQPPLHAQHKAYKH